MKILIIGFGSIGKRHYEILNTFDTTRQIDIVTHQSLENITTYRQIEEIPSLEMYDYFIIATPTHRHYQDFYAIAARVEKKKILIEKPLFEKSHIDIDSTNSIFTAYNLRFHPIIMALKEMLENETIYYANIICGQYLPTWRPHQDYQDSYSAHQEQGGGVLRDLSHEIDYASWLFGKIVHIEAINTKISDLMINSDDIFTAIALSDKSVIINLSMDYISKTPLRRIIIHTQEYTIEANMIQNTLHQYDKKGNKESIAIEQTAREYTYAKMHHAIIQEDYKNLCTYEEGSAIVALIDTIRRS